MERFKAEHLSCRTSTVNALKALNFLRSTDFPSASPFWFGGLPADGHAGPTDSNRPRRVQIGLSATQTKSQPEKPGHRVSSHARRSTPSSGKSFDIVFSAGSARRTHLRGHSNGLVKTTGTVTKTGTGHRSKERLPFSQVSHDFQCSVGRFDTGACTFLSLS